MDSELPSWNWSEGPVDRQSDHFEIYYGDASTDPDEWTLVALVGRSANGMFVFESLVDNAEPENSAMIITVEKELNFYIVEKREPDPWHYLRYHCGTSANIYSKVHWSFHARQPSALPSEE